MRKYKKPENFIDEMVELYTSPDANRRKWFARNMRLANVEVQDQVWKALDELGFRKNLVLPQTPEVQSIDWTDSEWDTLAEAVWRVRKNNPALNLVELLQKVQSNLTLERRRRVSSVKEIGPILNRLVEKDKSLMNEHNARIALEKQFEEFKEESKEEINSLNEQLRAVPTREEILGTLTNQEVQEFFKEKILSLVKPEELIAKFDIKTIISHLPLPQVLEHVTNLTTDFLLKAQEKALEKEKVEEKSPEPTLALKMPKKPTLPTPKVRSIKLPKITIIGLLTKQERIFEKKLGKRAQLCFVDKDKNRTGEIVPKQQDLVFLMANFISHTLSDQVKNKVKDDTKIEIFHGGISEAVIAIEKYLDTFYNGEVV
jgi:hypothetical protein